MLAQSVLKDFYYVMAYINGGGMDLEWAKKELFREWADSRDAFQLMAQEIEQNAPKPSGVIFIPHLRGRNFPTQPWLRGVFAGFSWDHRRENLYRAILEGIAFEYAFYLKVIRESVSYTHLDVYKRQVEDQGFLRPGFGIDQRVVECWPKFLLTILIRFYGLPEKNRKEFTWKQKILNHPKPARNFLIFMTIIL